MRLNFDLCCERLWERFMWKIQWHLLLNANMTQLLQLYCSISKQHSATMRSICWKGYRDTGLLDILETLVKRNQTQVKQTSMCLLQRVTRTVIYIYPIYECLYIYIPSIKYICLARHRKVTSGHMQTCRVRLSFIFWFIYIFI